MVFSMFFCFKAHRLRRNLSIGRSRKRVPKANSNSEVLFHVHAAHFCPPPRRRKFIVFR